jgi:Flp pilus assembly protein TadG
MIRRHLRTREIVRKLARQPAAYVSDRRGNMAAVFALLAIPLIGALSLAGEASSWFLINRAAQNAADSAALAAAANDDTSTCTGGCPAWNSEALSVAANSGFTNGTNNTTVTAINNAACPSGGASNCYKVTVTKKVPLYLVGAVGYTGTGGSGLQTIQATAMAGPGQGGNVCILATDTRASDIHTVFGGNNATVTISGVCQVADNLLNSSDTDDVDVKSGAVLNFYSLYMRDASKCDSGSCQGTLTVNQPIQYNQPAVTDPYAGRTVPAATGSCDHTNMTVTTTTTLSQGTYCGTNGNAALTIGPASTNLNTTSNPPPTGTTVLNFASTAGVLVGNTVSDTTHTSAIPAGTTVRSLTATSVTLSATVPGGPMGVNMNDVINFAGAAPTVTLSSGVYILDGQGGGTGASACTGTSKPSGCLSGDLILNNGAVVTGTGVTIVLTTSKGVGIDVGNAYIENGASLSISAPISNVGGYQVAGIALWQNPIAPNPAMGNAQMFTTTPTITQGVNIVSAGASTDITGLIYFPSEGLLYSGGSGGDVCTQIVAFSIGFQNSSQFSYPTNCPSLAGEQSIGSNVKFASLVQ